MDNVLPKKLYQILLEFKVGDSTFFTYSDDFFYASLEDELLKKKIDLYKSEKIKAPNQLLGTPTLINYYIVSSDFPGEEIEII